MKNNELDILNDDHLSRIIQDIETNDNKQRKLHAWKAFNCLEGNQKQYVKEEIVKLYPKTWQKFRLGDLLIVKKVINKLGKAYKQDPIRTASNDKETDLLDEIYTKNGFKRAFKEFDKIFNLHKYACYWLKFLNPDDEIEGDEGSYNLQALAPYEYDLVRDEVTGEPLIFALSFPDSETTSGYRFGDGIETRTAESQADQSAEGKIYSVWSRKNFVKVKAKIVGKGKEQTLEIQRIADENNEKNLNQSGSLPIVFLSQDTSVDYPIANNLSDQSINWNTSFTDYRTASAAQGHGVLTYSFPDSMKPKETIHTGMHTAIDLPQSTKPNAPETKADFINANPNLSEQLDGLKFEASNILDDHGINAGTSIEGQNSETFASGFDRLLSSADVQDIVEDNQSVYVYAEQKLFKLLTEFENALNRKTFKTDQDLSVTFLKPTVLISDKETLENLEARERLGLLLPWEKHQVIDPNLDKTAAEKREKEIQDFKKQELKDNQDLFDQEDQEDEDDDKAV